MIGIAHLDQRPTGTISTQYLALNDLAPAASPKLQIHITVTALYMTAYDMGIR